MAIRSGTPTGRVVVPVPGTPVRVTAANADPRQHVACHGIMFQVLPTNTGRVYVGGAQLDRVAVTNVFAMLPAPSSTQLPNFSAAITQAPNALGVEEFWIDADNAGEGVIVTILIL